MTCMAKSYSVMKLAPMNKPVNPPKSEMASPIVYACVSLMIVTWNYFTFVLSLFSMKNIFMQSTFDADGKLRMIFETSLS